VTPAATPETACFPWKTHVPGQIFNNKLVGVGLPFVPPAMPVGEEEEVVVVVKCVKESHGNALALALARALGFFLSENVFWQQISPRTIPETPAQPLSQPYTPQPARSVSAAGWN
jgi:hypothetical protein